MPTFSEQTTKFPALFVLLQWESKIFDPQLSVKIVRWLKVNKQALEILRLLLSLEIHSIPPGICFQDKKN